MSVIIEDFELYEFLNLDLPNIPPRSRLYSIEPQGLGTPYVESLTSYMVRLAQAHSVTVRTLIIGALAPLLKRRYLGHFDPKDNHLTGFLKHHSQILNGTTRLTHDFVHAIEIMTLRKGLVALTLLPLVNITTNNSLQKGRKAWCPECFSEWRSSGTPVYEPLLWQINAVVACPRHKRPLINQCPHKDCQSTMQILAGSQIDIGYCLNCSRWLGVGAISQNPTTQDNEELSWNIGVSESAAELLEHALMLRELAHLNNLPILIDAYLEQAAHYNKHEMEENIKISRATLTSWQRMRRLPQFPSLLKLCRCSGISVLDLITLSPKIFQSSVEVKVHLLPDSMRYFKKVYKTTRYDLTKMRQQLEEILESSNKPPPSMRSVGRLLGRDDQSIRIYFPDLCKAISRKYVRFSQQKLKRRYQKMRKIIVRAVLEIDAKGIYPSYHKVAAHLGKDFSLDRRVFSKYWNEGLAEIRKRKA